MENDNIKEALRRIPYGFYSITSKHGDDVNAMVLNWMTQVSFEQRYTVFAIQKTSYSIGLIQASRKFCLNIFNGEDVESIKPLVKSRAKNPDKLKGIEYSQSTNFDIPVINGAAAYIEYEVHQFVDFEGDHLLVIGKPINAEILKDGSPRETLKLLDLGWSYAG